jgi:hypothetical protein
MTPKRFIALNLGANGTKRVLSPYYIENFMRGHRPQANRSAGGAARFRRIQALLEIDQAAAAQERCEIADLAMDLQRLVMEL